MTHPTTQRLALQWRDMLARANDEFDAGCIESGRRWKARADALAGRLGKRGVDVVRVCKGVNEQFKRGLRKRQDRPALRRKQG